MGNPLPLNVGVLSKAPLARLPLAYLDLKWRLHPLPNSMKPSQQRNDKIPTAQSPKNSASFTKDLKRNYFFNLKPDVTSSPRSRYPSESLTLHVAFCLACLEDGDKEPITSWQCQETHLPRVLQCPVVRGERVIHHRTFTNASCQSCHGAIHL